jgi:nitric oxide reductase NorE protein
MFTGIHLMHVLIGMAILGRLIAVTRRAELTAKDARLCETGGIFWHMVDLLWVVLFALFYLVR